MVAVRLGADDGLDVGAGPAVVRAGWVIAEATATAPPEPTTSTAASPPAIHGTGRLAAEARALATAARRRSGTDDGVGCGSDIATILRKCGRSLQAERPIRVRGEPAHAASGGPSAA
ncbi:hypothetical protein BIU97_10220 [Curtobacterium sp. MCBA15_009]|nr:hypothetical protein BIU97_10220 [Curtobacterium sp. MCBA15_009]